MIDDSVLKNGGLEVLLSSEQSCCEHVKHTLKAKVTKGFSTLCCLNANKGLDFTDIFDSGQQCNERSVEGNFTNFIWEDSLADDECTLRLLALGADNELCLYELEREDEGGGAGAVTVLCSCTEHTLRQLVEAEHLSLSSSLSFRLLSYQNNKAFVLLNNCILLHLLFSETGAEPEVLNCSTIDVLPQALERIADCQICAGVLFVLDNTGHIYIYDTAHGQHLASVDLCLYQTSLVEQNEDPCSLSSFALLKVSHDLITAVAVTCFNSVICVDFNDYFRKHPEHLLCVRAPDQLPLKGLDGVDEDNLSSSDYSKTLLGVSFQTNRSWDAQLSVLYNDGKASSPSDCATKLCAPWYHHLPNAEPTKHSDLTKSQVSATVSNYTACILSCAAWKRTGRSSEPLPCKRQGFVQLQGLRERMTPATVSVSEFTVLLTFVSSDSAVTVAFWDLQTQDVTYHHLDPGCTPVQCSGEEQLCLVMKESGLSVILFGFTQEELLSRLMIHGSAGTVDLLCHLNSWGRCCIPAHALEAGLKNRQLDTVDFFLKSKENILCPPAGYTLPEQPGTTPTHLQLKNVEDLRPALTLLSSAIKDNDSEAQSKQFSEQLLNMTLTFLNKQVREILINTEELNEDLQKCVDILSNYISELRTFMKKFPRPQPDETEPWHGVDGGHLEIEHLQEWQKLSSADVIRSAIMSNRIPEAQAFFRSRQNKAERLEELLQIGLNLAYECLLGRELKEASELLRNMGFSVKKQLHSICFYTDDRDLRDFLVDNLQKHNYLSDREIAMVEFIKQVEGQCFSPAKPTKDIKPNVIPLQMQQNDPKYKTILDKSMNSQDLLQHTEISTVLLDWARWWDKNIQENILLSRMSKEGLQSCDPEVLWMHLTSLHDRQRVHDWVETFKPLADEPSDQSQWPALTAEIVNHCTLCSGRMRNEILDLLARRGVFIPSERADLEKLLVRLGHAGGVMQETQPVPGYHSSDGLDFHSHFIHYCLENSLRYLLYVYLEYYQLDQSNCPILKDEDLYEAHPWFELLVKIQEIIRNPRDPSIIFQSSLTNAQIQIPSNQASVSSMLLEGHTLLGLATIMFAPGGFDQVVSAKEEEDDSLWKVDPQLLKMALAPYPKLKSALFPQTTPRGVPPPDISVYHLVQSLFPFDSSRQFGWQSANTLATVDTSSELPHFSCLDLVNKYAITERLDFLYYLRHGRPSFAFGTFLVQQLSKNNSTAREQMTQAAMEAYKLGLLYFDESPVAAACVCFYELLGLSSLKFRVDLKVANLILKHWTRSTEESQNTSLREALAEKLQKLVETEKQTAEELLIHVEAAVLDNLERRNISRTSYESGQEWSLVAEFCRLHAVTLSTAYLQDCARQNEWLQFLTFIQLHNYQPEQVKALLKEFSPALKDHLSLAFDNLQFVPPSDEENDQGHPEAARPVLQNKKEKPHDLFQALLLSQDQPSPWRYLLSEALGQHCPVLSVLAACVQDSEILQCLCVWVLSSVDDITIAEATSHIQESVEHHEWNLHDLSLIWKVLVRRQRIKSLIRGFQLFQKDSPLVYMLQMYELCNDYKNYSEAKTKLLLFQKCLISLKTMSPKAPAVIPVQWLEVQALSLLHMMMQQCRTQYELRKLLQLLADMDSILKTNGPDFKKLSILSEILQDTRISISLPDLASSPAESLQNECRRVLGQLLEEGLFPLARRVAELAELPVDSLVIQELIQELRTLKEHRQWERKETRINFWRKCNDRFQSNGINSMAVSEFFLARAEAVQMEECPLETRIVSLQERWLLLTMAGYWLARQDPVPVEQLEEMEKRIWLCRIRQEALLTATESTTTFFRPVSVAGDCSFEVLIKEFSFSKLGVLNCPEYLKLEGLPAKEASETRLDATEREALAALIGKLLDGGCIHEASRVCRYFDFFHRDVSLVLHCRALASGEAKRNDLHPTIQVILTAGVTMGLEGGTRRMPIPGTVSVGSCSSFDMVLQPEDQLIKELQILADECHHGKNYCRQVLSLFQLSQELGCSYSEISAQDWETVLREVLRSQQPDRYKRAQAFITIQGMETEAVAELVSGEVVQALVSSAEGAETAVRQKQIYNPGNGKEAFLQLAKLCQDPNLVGTKLLDKISSMPHGELACTVDLLVLAHDCFSLTCHMEGIVRVLQAARHLCHNHLAPSEKYSLMVRLLTGIGRYNDMTYIFDLLHQNHRFEMLLRKKVESNATLKTALLDYIKRCHPGDSEKHNMVALCFSMCREIGENHEGAARTQLKLIESQPWTVTPELKKSLVKVLTLLKDAAESYSKDCCARQALRCIKLAKLVTLQLHFLNNNQDRRLINLPRQDLLEAMISLPSFYQAFVVAEAYNFIPDWAEVLYQQVIVRGDFTYLEEFKQQRLLQASLFEEISKKFKQHQQHTDTTASQNLKKLLKYCEDIYIYYKLAYEHKFFDVANMLLQDTKTSCYLNDKLAS
ncbi:spatacsin-like isoform X1 [Polyodon spathula]|uniref:spatacsin-like isoform X1 n=1 Tax=Polyodon spathula TaxID=7913 RepID=UPI001B7F3627|nr:spatacsin-like isoform X1 [Polyodon spathula]